MVDEELRELLGAHAEGPQKPESQNGMEAHTTGRAASDTSIPSQKLQIAAAAIADANPPATQTSVLKESFPTIFSSYSPMSFWIGICSDMPHAP